MSEVKRLIDQIREYENKATYAKMTNEKELPHLKYLLSSLDEFGFGEEDLDLKRRLEVVALTVQGLEVVGITNEILEECRKEASAIRDELVLRYRDRMEAYASRQSNL